jgi:hypothetical protein
MTTVRYYELALQRTWRGTPFLSSTFRYFPDRDLVEIHFVLAGWIRESHRQWVFGGVREGAATRNRERDVTLYELTIWLLAIGFAALLIRKAMER